MHTYSLLFERNNSCMKTSRFSPERDRSTITSSWRRSSGRVQPHRLFAPFSVLLEAILANQSIRSGEGDRLQATERCDWSSYGGRLGDPRSRLLKSGDGERGFAFTRKNLCHSFNGAAHQHPAFPRDRNARFDSLRRRINFILRLSSCTRALRRFSRRVLSRSSAFRESLNVVDRRVDAFVIFFLCPFDRSRKMFIPNEYWEFILNSGTLIKNFPLKGLILFRY